MVIKYKRSRKEYIDMKYIFMTDASCDLSEELVKEIGVRVIPMEFEIDGNIYMHYPDCCMMKLDEFYDHIKNGAVPKTSQINIDGFKNYFEPYLKAGKDILYTGIPTGLSGTFNTCKIAADELMEKYPERKIVLIDSCCDSAGLGYLVYLAGKKYAEGADIDEVAAFIDETKQKIGGRISTVAATFGKALQIKPLISVDETGKLVNVGKIRGASNVIPALVERFKRDSKDMKKETAFVAHADNPEGAKELKKAIKGLCKNVIICEIGPVIGSHVGTGMLAVLFLGERNLK